MKTLYPIIIPYSKVNLKEQETKMQVYIIQASAECKNLSNIKCTSVV
jgi:hypothetical protein